jgi:predicted RNase H-like HicB family nuclease
MAATYQVELERDEREWWVASVPAVPGVHTQGRSIAQAMNRIREALSLWVDEAERANLIPSVHLSAAARVTVRRASSARERAERAEEEALDTLRDAIRELKQRESLSTRDIATLLDLSPSRVDQLKPGRSRVRGSAARTR